MTKSQGSKKQTREAGTDVSWRNGASVQTTARRDSQQARETTMRATMMAECGSASRLRDK